MFSLMQNLPVRTADHIDTVYRLRTLLKLVQCPCMNSKTLSAWKVANVLALHVDCLTPNSDRLGTASQQEGFHFIAPSTILHNAEATCSWRSF